MGGPIFELVSQRDRLSQEFVLQKLNLGVQTQILTEN